MLTLDKSAYMHPHTHTRTPTTVRIPTPPHKKYVGDSFLRICANPSQSRSQFSLF